LFPIIEFISESDMDWKTAASSRWAMTPVRSLSGGEIVTAGFYHYKLRNEETNDTCVIAFYGIGGGLSVVPAAYSENLKFYYKKIRSKRPTSFDDLNLRRAQLIVGSIQGLSGQNASGFVLKIQDGYSRFSKPLMIYKSISGSADFGYSDSFGTPTAGIDIHDGVIHVKWDEVERGLPDNDDPIPPSWDMPVIPYLDPPPPPRRKTRVRLEADVLFGFDSTKVRPEAAKELGAIAYEINKRTGPRVTIEGHADSVGNKGYNQTLSVRRAQAVKDWFVKKGVFNAHGFAVTGKGETDPIADNATKAGRAQNRRVEITIE
jgi:outer membrane protein OmpA-like peptidoglycan-associated protein